MTEWEKMQTGQIYNDFDEDLFNRRVAAKKLFKEFNRTDDCETDRRREIMCKLFKKVGANVWIEPDFRCEFGGNITIGDNTLIGPNVGIYNASHVIDAGERIAGGLIPDSIRIGNRVWIGGNVVLVSWASIGDDTVVGAGSVVVGDIPSGVVAAGNPCRVIRKITDKDKTGFAPEKHSR